MAINIISNPNSVVSAFNQMAFNVSSTQAGQTNFNFLADVYVKYAPLVSSKTEVSKIGKFSDGGKYVAIINNIYNMFLNIKIV